MRMWFVSLAATLGLCAAVPWARADAPQPLPADDYREVSADVLRALQTREEAMPAFRPQVAPDVIPRWFATPDVAREGRNMRENALAVAGPGRVLQFNKPSDVLATMERWFPNELATARSHEGSQFPDLVGPYPGWTDDSIAWVSLWQCMPMQAWLQPGRDPFLRGRGLSPWPSVVGSDEVAGEFGNCIRRRTRMSALDAAGRLAWVAQVQDMAARATPVLAGRFDAHLRAAGCSGTGPDDCVLVLLLWSQLAPSDTRLAQALQRLEPLVAPDAPLPPLARPIDSYQGYQVQGEPRHVMLMRRAAFLRAKVASVRASSAWPAGAQAAVLRQLAGYARQHDAAIDWRWSDYQLRGDDRWNPWVLLRRNDEPALFEAVVNTLDDEVRSQSTCPRQQLWFGDGRWGGDLTNRLALLALARPGPACYQLQWDTLRQGRSEEARNLRQQVLDRLADDAGTLREQALRGLTHNGDDCFASPVPALAQPLCQRWIHEPQHTSLTLAHARLSLTPAATFRSREWQAPEGMATEGWAWLDPLSEGLDVATAAHLRGVFEGLKEQGQRVFYAKQWRQAGHAKVLLRLNLADNRSTERWFVLSRGGAQPFTVPERFRGEHGRQTPVRVTDLDRDGRLELWWAEDFDRCSDTPDDASRDMFCQKPDADMGEIDGNSLSYFVADRPASGLPAMATGTLPAGWESAYPADRCNLSRLAAVLAEPLDLHFGRWVGETDDDIIDMTCKPHPGVASQWLVALFHNKPSDEEVGFLLAQVDMRTERLVRSGRSTVGIDGSTRVGGGSLKLDTARWFLQPGRRAIGVRMNIGWSPHAAEGGSSGFLSLFAPEGAKGYRLVLDQLPMSQWALRGDCFRSDSDDDACTRFELTRSMAVQTSQTRGWRDLLVNGEGNVSGPVAEPPDWWPTGGRLLRMGASGRYE